MVVAEALRGPDRLRPHVAGELRGRAEAKGGHLRMLAGPELGRFGDGTTASLLPRASLAVAHLEDVALRPHGTRDLDARAVQSGDPGDAGDANRGATGFEPGGGGRRRQTPQRRGAPHQQTPPARGAKPGAGPSWTAPGFQGCSRHLPRCSRPCGLRRARGGPRRFHTPPRPHRKQNRRRLDDLARSLGGPAGARSARPRALIRQR